jgi:hypothetical protein
MLLQQIQKGYINNQNKKQISLHSQTHTKTTNYVQVAEVTLNSKLVKSTSSAANTGK